MVTALMERPEASLSTMDQETISKLVLGGDLSKLTPEQKVSYYGYRCKALNLDPATKPFDLLKLNGKEVLYATRECSNQISQRDGLSATVVKQEAVNDVYMVTARVTDSKGRQTDDVGCVPIKGVTGDALCNAIMKATTKAKRRAILSHAGLGMMDETEIETVKDAVPSRATPVKVVDAPAKEPLVVVDADPFKDMSEPTPHELAKADGYMPEPAPAPIDVPRLDPEIQKIQEQVIGKNFDAKIPEGASVMLVEVKGYNPNPRPVGQKGSMSYSLRVLDLDGDGKEQWTSTFNKEAWETGKLLKGGHAHLTYKLKNGFLNFYHIEKAGA
jgi:hypothetical protein